MSEVMANLCAECCVEIGPHEWLCDSCQKDARLATHMATQTYVELVEILTTHIVRTSPEVIRLIVRKCSDEVRQMLLDSFETEVARCACGAVFTSSEAANQHEHEEETA